MSFFSCNQDLSASHVNYYEKVDAIPNKVYEDLKCKNNLYFHPSYLIALETHNSQIKFAYIVLSNELGNYIGFFVIQVIDFYSDSFQDDTQTIFEYLKCIARNLRILPQGKPLKVLTCGNTFVTGEHGVFIRSDQDKKNIVKQFSKAIAGLVNSKKELNEEIDVYMIKDFTKESTFITDELKSDGFYDFKVAPNMVMKINKEWNDFEDYLLAMKTKFRVKAKKALLKSERLHIADIQLKDLDSIIPQMTELYKKVSNKASFNLGAFNLITYKTLKENLGEYYILKGYWLGTKLVGFMSGVINQKDILDAHFVGIDYDLNRELAIYQRMLYDYVDIAIQRKVKQINFGRTASEIKSSVGATPEEMTIYLKHRKHLPNKILSLFLKKIKPTGFNQKYPFKSVPVK